MTDGAVRRVAAVDCGTNSIRLLVADVDVAVPATDTAAPATGAPSGPLTVPVIGPPAETGRTIWEVTDSPSTMVTLLEAVS